MQYQTMANTGLLTACAGAYILYRVLWSIYSIFFHPLSKFPGPKLWAISRIPWAYHVIKGDIWHVQLQLHNEYGPMVRIAPDEISTISPAAWKDIYFTRPELPKDPYGQTPPLNGAHSLFTAADATHKRIRGALVNAFSDKALREQSPIIAKHADRFTARIRRDIDETRDSSNTVDIQKLFGYATFDTVTDLSFGESFDGLQGDLELKSSDNTSGNMIQNFFLHAKFGPIRNCLTRFAPLDILLGLFLLSTTRKSRNRNWANVISKVQRRLATGDLERSDFISPVMGRIDESGKKGISTKELTTNSLAFVIADCQLSTITLANATYFLLQDGEAKWQRLVDEICSCKDFNSEADITVQSTQGLPYLEAVINESMRIRHPTPNSLPRVTPPCGRVVDGQFIPGNTIIGIHLHSIQTSPSHWVDPNGFHPERFLPETDPRYDPRFQADVKEAFLPFSSGPRNCIGGKVFLAQARVFLARLAWAFDLALKEGQNDLDCLGQKAWLVFEPKPVMVRIASRLD